MSDETENRKMSIKEREGLTRPLSTSSEGCKAFRVPLNGRKERQRELYPSYRGRGEENRDNRQTIELHLKQRPSEEPEVEKPTNNRIPAKSFTSVNLWNTDCRAADNSQGSLKQGYSAKDY